MAKRREVDMTIPDNPHLSAWNNLHLATFEQIWVMLSPRQKKYLASGCRVTYDHLKKLASGRRKPSGTLAELIARVLGPHDHRRTSRQRLFPDL